ncbi:sodium/potassium/calcium exchanger 4-like isoform X3 [Stylophora pistillata]|nr:sodium/potassium/calcium exchanger 4-like isoform X3 [Stylophora pistillata]XP_022791927.1 sodium/potassium/calcium exchanger 4-like isoform X3 [Stylophora pistillata]XP_022791934.1 sodium/potassium/calcium exchanger 4-like isoform X3 [Stylophora pistillata]XP_022791940.1 sodium/potassium/calcium exchanger 4-like isoform X3 [Stylophora pistillata]XP_022791949.1 sodium/potassium/calcium exchanger 4-like isoform X3 [Stylophora pistillata]XP_022791954.1 sodium/potassium/calcium exchanger 4-lik
MSWCRGRRTFSSRPPLQKCLILCCRILVISLLVGCGLILRAAADGLELTDGSVFQSRHLLSSVEWETCNFEIGHSRNYSARETWWAPDEAYGWLALHIFSVLVIFVALAIVCDDFFVPSLEAISEKLDLSEDVAGATFMAAGSSAPELFTSVAGVTVESDVGIGTIVGSAVFNLLVIIALTAALAGQVLQLDWRPLIRDSICYALSLGFFSWFAWDGKFELYESIILLGLYFLYIVLMKFNTRLMDLMGGAKMFPKDEELPLASHTLHKGGQVSPQNTEVTQFVSSDIDVQSDHNAQSSSVAIFQGRQGVPAGKLPPIRSVESNADEGTNSKVVLTANLSDQRRFSHANKGQVSRSFINLSLGRSHHSTLPVKPRLSVSFPGLRELYDNPKAHRRSSAGVVAPGEKIRLKSVAQKQVMKEYRRRSEMAVSQQPTVSVVHVDANGNAHTVPIDDDSEAKSGVDSKTQVRTDEEKEVKMKICPCLPAVSAEFPEYPEERGVLAPFKYFIGWVLFVVSFPFICMFTWTIPDCSKPHNRKYFLASFTMSIIWIAILSFGMVTLVGRSGCILSVDKFTMGLVVIAIGTSIPDALSSIIVARDGFGDMAVSNAIGSNVFDINLGIGLPFVIRIMIDNFQPIRLLTPKEEKMLSSGSLVMVPHVKFGFILLLILIIALGIFASVRFKLNRKIGISFLTMYIAFVIYAYVQDMLCDYDC